MQAAPSPAPPSGPAPPSPPPAVTAWPRSAQLTLVLLLVLVAALVAVYAIGSLCGSRPTEIQAAPLSHRIDLNQAGHAELLQLPGVGEKTAQRIEDQRKVDEQALELAKWRFVLSAEDPEAAALQAEQGSRRGGSGKKKLTVDRSSRPAGPINLNRASADELHQVPGIPQAMLEGILAERARGPFKSVDDLRRVRGIGAKTLERLRPFLTVEDAPAKVAPSQPADGTE